MATKSATAIPRASRSMVLSFGMFNVNVAMAPLFNSDRSEISGHMHCVEHQGRVKQSWYCEHGDHYVSGDEIETAYDYAGTRVVLGSEDLRSLESERDGIVTLRQSCPVVDIDPSYFEKAYLIWPQAGSNNEQAYLALAAALRNTDAALIGQTVVSKTDRMLVLRWSKEHGCVLGHVCNFAANLKHDAVGLVQAGEAAWSAPSDAFVAQAELLIGSLLADFDPELVEDTYNARLEATLSAQVHEGTAGVPVSASMASNEETLMESLAASIKAAEEAKA